MKKTILSTTFLIAGTMGVLAQGLVDFSNAPWELWPPGTAPDRFIYVGNAIAGGVLVPSETWTCALFENRGGNWVQLGEAQPFFGAGLEGIIAYDGVQRVVSVPAGTSTELKIEVIDPSGLPTRVTEGVNTFTFAQGTSVPASPTDTLFVNMRAFSVVPIPEPSTVALGVLGLGALLLFRRRK